MLRRKQKGFTLTELTVVLAVSSIIILIVVTLIATMQKHSQFRAADALLDDELGGLQRAVENVFNSGTYDSSTTPAPKIADLSAEELGNLSIKTKNALALGTENGDRLFLRYDDESGKYQLVLRCTDNSNAVSEKVLFTSERIFSVEFSQASEPKAAGENNSPGDSTETTAQPTVIQNENFVLCTVKYYITTDTERTYRFWLEKHSENLAPVIARSRQ